MHSSDELPPTTAKAKGSLYTVGVVLVLAMMAFTAVLYERRENATASERDERTKKVANGPQVLVAPVQDNSTPRTVTLPGDVRPFKGVTLYAKTSGYLKDIKVDKGDVVKEGQVLGIVESPETDQQLLSVQADMVVKRQIEQRYRGLVGSGVVSAQEMDNATAALQSAEAELARLKALKEYEIIRAPFNGTVTARYVDPGALLPAATGTTESAQPLVDVQDFSIVRVFVYVGQAEAPFVHAGDKVHITGENGSSLDINAPITRIAHALDPRTRTMLVEIDLPTPNGEIYPGLFLRVVLTIAATGGLTIPADAVFLRAGNPFVAVIAEGKAHFKPVVITENDGIIARVASGLSANDIVGLHIGDEVSDGAAVTPISLK